MMAPVFSRASWRCVWHMIQVSSINIYASHKENLLEFKLVAISMSVLIVQCGRI